MTKQLTNEPTDLALGNRDGPLLGAAQPDAPQRTGELQLLAFRDLARRIQTDLSAQRYEAALQTLLKKPRRVPTAPLPKNSPES